MSDSVALQYVCTGGNRHSAASAWSRTSNVLAFGADQNVALWKPLSDDSCGISHLLHGHRDKVTAVEFLTVASQEYLSSASADGKLHVWTHDASQSRWQSMVDVEAHTGAVNCIATIPGSKYLVTGGADAKIKLWKLEGNDIIEVLSIIPKPRLIPLTLVLGSFSNISVDAGMFLAAGGTRNDVQIYALKDLTQKPSAQHQATLKGHEGWIRSLCLRTVDEGNLLLASASHDKYVRLWRFEDGGSKPLAQSRNTSQIAGLEQTLSAKKQKVSVASSQYSITFEALLLGHEDWVYSAAWDPDPNSERLLTASADGTLTIWELDPSSGIWISGSKLGEISGQKGATTATGSSGGFWTGIWSPDGQTVTCLGRTGSWRIWQFDQSQQYWVQRHGVSGHTSAANGLAWSHHGGYLLSTSSDQTTRLHAEWKRGSKRSWHEFARPQIHGYDLNSISSIGDHQFVSGADEKLLRVFNEPRDIAKMLTRLCGVEGAQENGLSENAAIPVLGLSNKAIVDEEDSTAEANLNGNQEYIIPTSDHSVVVIEEPPHEDLLARHTLWPEHEKLYGHGYEISESAFSSDGQILATACKASSIDHAVIRLYDTVKWSEIKPPLTAHSLTVTRLVWSPFSPQYLLSVGRDRQWAIFEHNNTTMSWQILQSNPKAHTRMILDAAWSPVAENPLFATAGRDKTVKLWRHEPIQGKGDTNFQEHLSIKRESPVTAVSFTANYDESVVVLAVGEESGALSLHMMNTNHQSLELLTSIEISTDLCPSKAVTRIAWRPRPSNNVSENDESHLAIAAADGSVRILVMNVNGLRT